MYRNKVPVLVVRQCPFGFSGLSLLTKECHFRFKSVNFKQKIVYSIKIECDSFNSLSRLYSKNESFVPDETDIIYKRSSLL